MSQGIKRLRPMGIADILDETVELYRNCFVLLAGIAAVAHVPYAIYQQYYLTLFTNSMMHASTPDSLYQFNAKMLSFYGVSAIGYLYLFVATAFITGAMTYAISERYLGRAATISESFRQVTKGTMFWQILAVVLIQGGAILVPMSIIGILAILMISLATISHLSLFIVIPLLIVVGFGMIAVMVYLGLRLAVMECSVVIEKRGIIYAITRTWKMMEGNLLKCLALFLLAGLVTAIVGAIATVPTQILVSTSMIGGGSPSQLVLILHTILGAVSSTVLAPISSIVTILLFYDIRIRKEGFDLELLANELDAKSRQDWDTQPLPQEHVASEQDDITKP